MVAVGHGRYEGQCGRCMRKSLPVAASTAPAAWAELKRGGWELYRSPFGGPGSALCPRCCKEIQRQSDARKSSREEE
jgi:hypothetical protein